MMYIVFNNEIEVAEANGRWLYARSVQPEYDKKMNEAVNPQITTGWDYGKKMLDGRIACCVPHKWKNEFVDNIGIELTLTEEDFPIPTLESV